jgi:ketosteroid isomerase-like protein
MSAENVEIIRRVYEAMARGDFWATGAVFDPEISWAWSPKMSGMTGVEEYRGIEGVEAATRDFFEALEWFRQEATELIDLGDEVLALTRAYARPRGSDREFEATSANLWTLRDGKVIRFRQFDTREEAFAAAGVSP